MMKRKFLVIFSLSMAVGMMAQTDVLTVPSTTTQITANDAGNYYSINTAVRMEQGKAYLLSLPMDLDGYYFGPDAKRFKVVNYEKLEDGSYSVSMVTMDDLEDFKANEMYYVTPDIHVDTITAVHPGVKTEVAVTPQGKELIHTDNISSTTGINEIQTGKLYQIKGTCYDLQGRRVSDLHKGETYIVGGRKLIIKQ